MYLSGAPCDEDGNILPAGVPPPPRETDNGPNDWTPYESRTEFETADFLFTKNEMSAGDIDTLLNLWAATLVAHDDTPPFTNHDELYATIDATPLGDVTWDSFTIKYNGDFPADNIPPWMTSNYDVWFRDPRAIVQNLLSNPDFDNEFDYSPLQEFDAENNHRYQDFMSGNWAWKQAVSSPLLHEALRC
jgi:hypothetical protein